MHLWTGGVDPPEEYIDLILCRDIFHCTPSELDAQDYQRVQDIWNCALVENEVRNIKANNSKVKKRSPKKRR